MTKTTLKVSKGAARFFNVLLDVGVGLSLVACLVLNIVLGILFLSLILVSAFFTFFAFSLFFSHTLTSTDSIETMIFYIGLSTVMVGLGFLAILSYKAFDKIIDGHLWWWSSY